MNNLIKVKVKDIWSPIYGDKKPNFTKNTRRVIRVRF